MDKKKIDFLLCAPENLCRKLMERILSKELYFENQGLTPVPS